MSKKACRIPASEPEIPDIGLGKFVDGYNSHDDSLPWGTLFGLFAFSGASIFLGIQVLNANSFAAVILFICGGVFGAFAVFVFIKAFLKRTRVFVYENGFIWETTRKKGEIIKRDKIDFNEVDGIDFPKTKNYSNDVYVGTFYKLTVKSKGQKVWEKSGSYRNQDEDVEKGGWEFLSLKAIMDRWTQIGLIRINEELNKNGFVCFYDKAYNRIEIGKNYIKIGEKIIQRENLKYSFDNGKLIINNDKQGSNWISKNNITIDVNSMTNSHLFLYTIGSLLGIR